MASKYSSKLQNKRVLVLGGTSGIGFCIAEAAVEFGAIVTVSSSRQAKIDATIEKLEKSYPDAKGRINGLACDLSNSATVEENLKSVLNFATNDGKNKLDHIAKTSGDALRFPKLADVTIDNIMAGSQVRFMASIILMKHAGEFMNKSSTSSVTITGGVNSHKPGAGWGVAAGIGMGNEGLATGFAVELAPIRVNCVAPGAIMTELWDSLSPEALKATTERFAEKSLTGGMGKPEDTAEAYLYFMRDNFVTGQTILTEGGYLIV